jgi:hypothetical protein
MRKLISTSFDITPRNIEGKCFTPSLIRFDSELIVSYRLQASDCARSDVGLAYLYQDDFHIKKFWRPTVQDYLPNLGGLGIEDCRLVSVGNRLGAIATTGTLPDFGPTLIVFSSDLYYVNAAWRIGKWAKNWSPVIEKTGGELKRLMYSPWGPILEFDGMWLKQTPPTFEINETMLRGGSQLISYGDGFLAVTHEIRRGAVGPWYVHRFVRYENDLSVRCVSEPFFLESENTLHLRYEYVSGLARLDDGRYVITYGVGYGMCKMAIVTLPEVETFVGVPDDTPDMRAYTDSESKIQTTEID